MADKSSRFYLVSEVNTGGSVERLTSGWNINPSISDSDAVVVGNALAELVTYEVTTFRRVDTVEFSPDEFDG